MKVIFLDIDGVLNTVNTFKEKKCGKIKIEIDEFRVEYLREIVEKTDAKIVLSSTWRMKFGENLVPLDDKAKELINIFSKYNLKFYDVTPIDKNRWRENEISSWLSQNREVSSFVIIDDDCFDLQTFKDSNLIHIKNKFSFTENNGLRKEHVDIAVSILNAKKKILKYNKEIFYSLFLKSS